VTTRSLPVRARRLTAALTAAVLGIGGAVVFAAPSFAESPLVVSVTPSTDLDSTAANSIAVTGEGFLTAEPVEVALVSSDDWTAIGPASTALVSSILESVVDGAFSTTLEVPAGTLDPAVTYGIATFAATDRAFDTLSPITVAPLAAVAAEEEAVVEDEAAPQSAARSASLATVAAGNVEGGSATWGISTYLNGAAGGRPNPLASAYVSPAAFDAASRLTSWGNAIGTVNADGSAELAFEGTSVNFAATGGGWLRLSGLEAHLHASGNGTVTAVVEYGTAPGTYPGIVYNPAQAGDRGPERVTLVTLAGNTSGAVRDVTGATWTGLAGTWNPAFTSFLAGDSANGIAAWSYASTVSSATGRTPSTFAFSALVDPVAQPTTYDTGSAAWGISTYLNGAAGGRPNPLASAYVSPASFDSVSRVSTWGGGSGTVRADGTASLEFQGTSVNFAATGGGWLTIKDIQATLDASGNGSVTGVVSYGTAPGTYPNIAFDPAQTPANGPTRVTLVTLAGNTTGAVQGASSATWTGLAGSWSSEFTSMLSGAGGTGAWAYASTVSGATGRTPSAFTFTVGVTPPAVTTAVALTASPSASVVAGTASTLTATVSPAAAGTVEFRNGSTVLGSSPVTAGVATYSATSLPVGSYAVTAYFAPADPAAYTASQSTALEYIVSAPVVAQPGSLVWGVKASLQGYVLGGGSISTSSGAGASGSSFVFPQDTSSAFNQSTGLGTSSYRGQVTFAYPAHGFSISLTNPRVQVDSATAGSIIVDVTYNGATTRGVTFATLFLGAATKTSGSGSTTFSGVPAALTSAGASAFQGFYSAGVALDPVTFVVGSPAASLASTSQSAPAARTAAATPPATSGITVTAGAKPFAGDEITIEADGFGANEEGILVVIYSEPTVLDSNAKADANGRLTWTGRLPAGLTGTHTLTFQGSVNRGTEIEIAPKVATAAEGCPVQASSITWGFKESFRSYISGSIANGEWTVADGATYTTPDFGWSDGQGAYDADDGLVAFAGSITFTGHGGVLNTTVANPQLRFLDADTAVLLLDVSGTTQDGATVDQKAVEFVDIDLAGALEQADGTITVTDAATVLTPAGAAAFGTYPAGESFDPVSFTLTLDPSCGAIVPQPGETATVTAEPVSSGGDLAWLWILIAAVVLLALAAAAIIVVRRRRTAA